MIRSLSLVVRPNVVPDVRPPRQPIKIETEDERDVEIIGKRGQCIDLSHNSSVSVSFTEKQAEQFRLVDKVRVSNPNRIPTSALSTPKGVTPQGLRQYVDLEVMHYIQYLDEFGHLIIEKFRKPEHIPSRGIFVTQENLRKTVAG